MQKNSVHIERFVHPCQYGKRCIYINSKEHTARFTHPCPKGKQCSKVTDDSKHKFQSIHPCPKGSSCKLRDKDREHHYIFSHINFVSKIIDKIRKVTSASSEEPELASASVRRYDQPSITPIRSEDIEQPPSSIVIPRQASQQPICPNIFPCPFIYDQEHLLKFSHHNFLYQS